MNEQRKLCVDCAHCFRDYWGLKCKHSAVALKDLATGEHDYAAHVRSSGKCGRNGSFFEPRPPTFSLWQRIVWWLWRWARS